MAESFSYLQGKTKKLVDISINTKTGGLHNISGEYIMKIITDQLTENSDTLKNLFEVAKSFGNSKSMGFARDGSFVSGFIAGYIFRSIKLSLENNEKYIGTVNINISTEEVAISEVKKYIMDNIQEVSNKLNEITDEKLEKILSGDYHFDW